MKKDFLYGPKLNMHLCMICRTMNFHSFVKVALTKNPKKRPTAERLIMHPFLLGDLSKRQALELLHKVTNPNHSFYDLEPDEDGV
jgi:serine/threonine protein kinase